jgi:hypothetical protein
MRRAPRPRSLHPGEGGRHKPEDIAGLVDRHLPHPGLPSNNVAVGSRKLLLVGPRLG